MKQNHQSRNGRRNEHSTTSDGAATGNGSSGGEARPNGAANGDTPLAILLAKADAMRGMIDAERDSARADLFAAMAMAELSDTAENDVLRRIKSATGAGLTALSNDYRRVKGTNAGDPVTEDKVALDFIDERGDGLRYCHNRGKWFVFDEISEVWRVDQKCLAFDFARHCAREAAKSVSSTDRKSRAIIGRAAFASGVEKMAKADQRVAGTIDDFDADGWLLGTPGGVVDLRTGGYVIAGRDALITRKMAVAPAELADCPLFLRFLTEATRGNAAFIEHIQRTLGYALVGLNPEQKLVFIHGPGANGKGVLVNLITWLFGDYAVTASMDTFTATKGDRHPTDIAMLAGARLVTATETQQGRMWDEQRVKQLTGGDRVSARFMKQDFFTFLPAFLPVISGNARPRLDSVGEAERRRFIIWPFMHKPPVKDTALTEKLRAEGGGILRWLMEGCLIWQAARDVGGDPLARPDAVRTATEDYFAEQGTLPEWVKERCVEHPTAEATPTALLDDYNDWARRQHEPGLSFRDFKERLTQLGFTRKKVNGKDYWVGIALQVDDAARGGEFSQF